MTCREQAAIRVEAKRAQLEKGDRCGLCKCTLQSDQHHRLAYYVCCGSNLCPECLKLHRRTGKCPVCEASNPRHDHEYIHILKRRVAEGDAEAQYRLGMKYHRGDLGLRRDLARAVENFELAAAQGYTKALCDLGQMYQEGDGVRADLKRAAVLYQKAAETGDALGQHLHATMRYKGLGCKRNVQDAVRYWRLASAQGNPKAHAFLGACLYKGDGIERDLQEALRLVKLAADAGVSGARRHAERIESILAKSEASTH